MFDILNKYLLQHKSISIPGLGSLVAETVPAVTDFANRQVMPVQLKFRFNKYFDAPDRDFFAYLSQQKNIPDFEAIKCYNEFAWELRNKIRTEDQAAWDGIGVFKKEVGNDVIFEGYPLPFEFYQPVSAERVIRADLSHSLLVGDKEKTSYEMNEILHEEVVVERESWWMWGLILAAVAIVVLFFHLYRTNMKWGATGNQQPVHIVQPSK